ncbi:MAG: sugar ABC transporter substrate-binding protein [Chloroflexi bacterium]|nr:MAG: sugar ABC transporter substrate-binding protein [Chloroflexota bacterium]
MKSKWFGLTSVLLVLMLLVVACGATNEAPPDSGAVQETPGDGGVIEGTPEGAATEEMPAEGTATEEMPAEGAATEAAPEGEAAAGECPVAVEEGATLTFSGWGDETEQQIYRDSITRFQEVCPGVTVNYEPIPADFQTKLKAAMAGGTAPDVFYVDDQLMTAFGQTGQLLPLDDYMAEAGVSADDFIPQLMPIFTFEDQIYGLPKDWGTLGLIYLPDVFDAAGVDYPTEDWTWEDMRTAAQTIAENTDSAGYCQGADWARFAPMVFSNGGAFASDDLSEATLDTPEVKEMAQLTADMYEEGSLVQPADIAASWCGEAIGKQLVGMTTEGGWMVNFMRQDYPDVNWQAVLIPAGPVTRADVIFTNAIGVNAATEYPAAAAALAIYITSAENQAEIVQTGFAYSTHPEQADLIQQEQDRAIAEGGLLEDSRVAYWGPNTGRINDSVSQALSRVFLGDQTVDEAFAQANEEVQEALDSAQ